MVMEEEENLPLKFLMGGCDQRINLKFLMKCNLIVCDDTRDLYGIAQEGCQGDSEVECKAIKPCALLMCVCCALY